MSCPRSCASQSGRPMAMTLSPSASTVSVSQRRRRPVADDAEQRAALGHREVHRDLPDGRRARLEVRLDDLELADAERRQVEQLVDRDVLLDGAEDHPGGADDLVDAEVPEQPLVLGVVDAGDRPRHVEVVLGHLADDEVVLVVAGDGGHDVGAVGAGLGEVLALAAVVRDDDGADLVRDLVRARRGPSPSGRPRGPRR